MSTFNSIRISGCKVEAMNVFTKEIRDRLVWGYLVLEYDEKHASTALRKLVDIVLHLCYWLAWHFGFTLEKVEIDMAQCPQQISADNQQNCYCTNYEWICAHWLASIASMAFISDFNDRCYFNMLLPGQHGTNFSFIHTLNCGLASLSSPHTLATN